MSDSETTARVKNSQSKSFRKLNPHLFDQNHANWPKGLNLAGYHGGEDDEEHDQIAGLATKSSIKSVQCPKCGEWVEDPSKHRHPMTKPKKRIRQSQKPELNKLEAEYLLYLKASLQSFPSAVVLAQSIRFRLGNGIWYKPDLVVSSEGISLEVYEVKGKHAFRGGFENLKVAASLYKNIRFYLVWKEQGKWQEQLVLP